MTELHIGTAGWSIPTELKGDFAKTGTHLERYSKKLNAVEINSSFYQDHLSSTYERWSSCVPQSFRFSVKLSKYFTHTKRLGETGPKLIDGLHSIAALGKKWEVLLVQIPPSLEFEKKTAETFFSFIKKHCPAHVVFEPRHVSWINDVAIDLLEHYSINKVLADPEPCRAPIARRPALEKIRYYRLHGAPLLYKSNYSAERIEQLAARLGDPISEAEKNWVIFDNTTFGFATLNAIHLKQLTQGPTLGARDLENSNPI